MNKKRNGSPFMLTFTEIGLQRCLCGADAALSGNSVLIADVYSMHWRKSNRLPAMAVQSRAGCGCGESIAILLSSCLNHPNPRRCVCIHGASVLQDGAVFVILISQLRFVVRIKAWCQPSVHQSVPWANCVTMAFPDLRLIGHAVKTRMSLFVSIFMLVAIYKVLGLIIR